MGTVNDKSTYQNLKFIYSVYCMFVGVNVYNVVVLYLKRTAAKALTEDLRWPLHAV